MTAPFNFGQLKFLKALTEALFHEAEMMISADQVVANVCDLFEKIGGTKLDEIRLSLTATEIVLGGPFRSEEHTSELQSLMRISYAVFCLKKKNNQIHRQIFTTPV